MSTERWLEFENVTIYEENDGWTYMNRGAECRKEIVSLEEALKRGMSPEKFEQATQLLVSRVGLYRKVYEEKQESIRASLTAMLMCQCLGCRSCDPDGDAQCKKLCARKAVKNKRCEACSRQ